MVDENVDDNTKAERYLDSVLKDVAIEMKQN